MDEHALRNLARGLHPALLTERGLGPAFGALATRASLPVTLENRIEERLPGPVEAAVYYVVSEALTNVAKHSSASKVSVRTSCAGGIAKLEVVDDASAAPRSTPGPASAASPIGSRLSVAGSGSTVPPARARACGPRSRSRAIPASPRRLRARAAAG
jgi:glucose-6-phosphate-specific signal transduction histidine kinase